MSKKSPAQPSSDGAAATPVRVLVDGRYGLVNQVVAVGADELDAAIASGEVDAHPDAVAYAESLPK